jgi:hypothetical protein
VETAEVTLTASSRRDPIKIVFLGDLHLGNAATDEKLIEQAAKRLRAKDTYWVDLGDACDFINMSDPRFDPRGLPDWVAVGDLADLPRAQVARYAELFQPVADKCLARLCGNHEDVLSRHYERDVYGELNRSIGLPSDRALGYSGFLRLRVARKGMSDCWTLTCFLHHGAGGGALAGSKALRLERLPASYQADIYAVGHTHTKMVLFKRRLGIDTKRMRLKERPLVMLNVGAWMRAEGAGYAERAGLYPQGLGPVELWLWPARGRDSEQIMKVVQ